MERSVKRKKKKSLFLKICMSILMIFFIIAGYFVYQYYEGYTSAEPVLNQEYEFNGAEKLDKINILLLGVDARDGQESSNSDTIMVAQYDPKNGTAKLISIMRDIYVEIPEYRNYKINAAFLLGGPELLRKTLKENFDLDIQYYALIDFEGFEKMIDGLAPDGIEIDVPQKMSKNIGVTLNPGLQNLDGKHLLGYVRFRHDAESDFGRVRRQQEAINALKDQVLSVNGLTKLPKLIGTVQPYVQTNLEGADLAVLVKNIILNPPKEIETLRIPIDNTYTNVNYEHAGLVLDIDFDKNKEALFTFLNEQTSDSQQFQKASSNESEITVNQ